MSYDISAMFNATAVSLRFPKDLRARVHRYVRQHQGGALIAEQAPFRRQLDLWAVSVALACAKELEPRPGPSTSWGDKFVDTRGVQLDPSLAELLVIIAAAKYGIDDERLLDPGEVVELANCYAAVGVTDVLKWLEDPGLRQTNIEKVLAGLKEVRQTAAEKAGVELGGGRNRSD